MDYFLLSSITFAASSYLECITFLYYITLILITV